MARWRSIKHGAWVVAGAAAVAATACAKPTPDRQVRFETAQTVVSPASGSLCERMAADYDMIRRAPQGDPLDADWGPEYRASFAKHALRARGVNFVLGVEDGTGEQRCGDSSAGVVCVVTGPAVLRVQTVVGDAQYRVAAGEQVRVASTGARLSCRHGRASSAAE